ncbi:MAG: hypothetical protein EA398_05490 [Deltaproteobacteria bacterium]|nr:MAG: hypothetical protein EA398_05490 [Deltaproteobacteria bacterium]
MAEEWMAKVERWEASPGGESEHLVLLREAGAAGQRDALERLLRTPARGTSPEDAVRYLLSLDAGDAEPGQRVELWRGIGGVACSVPRVLDAIEEHAVATEDAVALLGLAAACIEASVGPAGRTLDAARRIVEWPEHVSLSIQLDAWLHLAKAEVVSWRDAHEHLLPVAEGMEESALRRFVDFIRDAGDARSLLPLLETRRRGLTDAAPARRVPVLLELAETSFTATRDGEIAVEYFREALEVSPAALGDVRERTRAMVSEHADPVLVDWLQSLARRGGSAPRQLREAMEAAELVPDGARRLEVLLGLLRDLGPEVEAGDRQQLVEAALALGVGAPAAVGRAIAETLPRLDPEGANALAEFFLSRVCAADEPGAVHGVLEAQLERCSDERVRSGVLLELARTEAVELGRPDLAAGRLLPLLADAPGLLAESKAGAELVLSLMEPLAERDAELVLAFLLDGEHWQDAVDLMAVLQSRSVDASETSELALRSARILEERLGDPEGAAARLLEAMQARPEERIALGRYRDLMRRLDRAEEEHLAVERLLRSVMDPEERSQLQRDRVQLLLRLGQADIAVLEAWRLRASDSTMREEAEELLRKALDGEDIVPKLPGLLDQMREVLDQEAGPDFARWLLEVQPAETPLGRAAARYLATTGELDAEGLRGFCRQLGNDAETAPERARLLQAIPPAERDEEDWLALAQVLEQQGESERSEQALFDGWDALPESSVLLERARALVDAMDDPAARVGFLERAARLESRGVADRVADLRALSSTFRVLGRPDLAFGVDAETLALQHSSDVVDAVRSWALEKRAYGRLYEVLDASANAVPDGAERAERERELGALSEDRLGRGDLAAAHWRRALAHATPGTWARREAADRLLAGAGDLDDVIVVRALEALRAEVGDENALERVVSLGRAAVAEESLDAVRALCDAVEERFGADQAALRPLRIDRSILLGDRTAAIEEMDGWLAASGELPGVYRSQRWALMLTSKDRVAAAVKEVAEALLADPEDEAVHEVLVDLPAEGGIRTRIAGSVESGITGAMADEDACRVLLRVGDLHHADGALAEAVTAWRTALSRSPGEERPFSRLRNAYATSGDTEELRSLLQERTTRVSDERERSELFRELARIAPDDAARVVALQGVIAALPADLDALRALSRLLRTAGREEELAEVLRTLGNVEETPETRKRHLFSLARLLAGPLRDADRAADVLEEILTLDPSEERALRDLERSCRQRDDVERLARILRLRVEHEVDDDARVELLRELAGLEESKLDNPDGAVRHLERIIGLEPGNLSVLEELARLHAAAERWEEHLGVLEMLADASGLVDLKAEVFLRAARVLHHRLDRHGEALDLLATAETMVPFRAEQVELARQVAEKGELWREWATLLKRFADRDRDERRRSELYAELGRVLHRRLEDPVTALAVLGEAFDMLGEPGPVLDMLEEVAEASESRQQLLPVYVKLRERAGRNEEVLWRAMHSSARIAEEVLGLPEKAFDVLAEAARQRGLRARAEVELERIARDHDLWTRHRDWLERRWQEEGEPDAETDVLLSKARVEEQELDNWEAAFETLIAATQSAPTNVRVRSELYRLAEAHEQWEIVLRLMEALQESVETNVRVELLQEMANIFDTRKQAPGSAFEQILRAWELSPDDEALRTRLQELAQRAARQEDLLKAWLWDASRTEVSETAVPALERSWRLAVQLGDGQVAIAALGRLCRYRPEDAALREELSALALRFDEPEASLVEMEEALASMEVGELRVSWLAEAEGLCERAGMADRRLVFLDELVERCPGEEKWESARRAVLLEVGRVDALEADLRASLASCEDAVSALPVALELRDVLLRERGDPERAAEALALAAERFPGDEEIRTAWVEHLEQYEMWERLVRVLVEATDRIEDPEVQREQLLRAASIADEYLGNAELVLLASDAILERSPSDVEALDLKVRALAAEGSWGAHVKTLEAMARSIAEGAAAATALGQAARVAETELASPERAIGLWKQALDRDPESLRPLLEQARLLAESGAAEEAEGLLERVVEAAGEDPSRARDAADALVAWARIRSSRGDALPEIDGLLERANALDPNHQEARELRLALLGEAGDAGGMLRVLEEQVAQAANDAQRARALCDRASWRVRNTSGYRMALKDLQDALQLLPDDTEILTLLADTLLLAGHPTEAAALYGELLESVPDGAPISDAAGAVVPGESPSPSIGVRLTLRLAYAFELAGALQEAFDHYTDHNLEHPDDIAATAGLARVAAARGNAAAAERYASEVFASLGSIEPGDALAPLASGLFRVRALAAEEEQRSDAALEALLEALKLDPATVSDRLDYAFDAALRSEDAALRGRALDALARQDVDPEARGRALVEAAEARFRDDAPREEILAAVTRALLASTQAEVLDPIFALLDRLNAPDAIERFLSPLIEHAEGAYAGRLLHVRSGARQQLERFAEAFDDACAALERLPHSATILRQVVSLGRASGQSERLAESLQRFLEETPPDETGTVAQAQRALAEVLLDDLNRPEDARIWLEALRATFPNDVRVLESLLRILDEHEEGDDAVALDVASDLVRLGALSETVLRTLERVYYASDHIDGVLQVLQVLRLAGAADDESIELLESLPANLPALGDGLFTGEFWDRTLRPAPLDAGVIQVVADATLAVLPHAAVPLDDAWTPPAADLAAAKVFRDLAPAFGLPDALFLLDTAPGARVRAIASAEGRVVLVPQELVAEEQDEALLRFVLARGLALARNESLLLHTLSPFEFLAFLEAALEPLLTDAEQQEPGDAALAEKVRVWRERIGPADRPPANRRQPRHRLPAAGTWRELMSASAVQAGVLASYESRRTFHRLREAAEEPAPSSVVSLRDLIGRQPELRAIVVFLLSPRYLEARRELGLAFSDAAAVVSARADGDDDEPAEHTAVGAPAPEGGDPPEDADSSNDEASDE